MATAVLKDVDRDDLVTSTVDFTNAAGAPTNPTTVTFSVINPTGVTSQTNYVSGSSGQVTNPSTGRFVLSLPVTLAGPWLIRCKGVGAVAQVATGVVEVKPDVFV